MPLLEYRYRPIHAACEKLFGLLAPMLPAVQGGPLSKPPPRVLVLKFGGMGEAVLARSLIEQLRRRNPSVTFDFLVEERTAETMTCGGGRSPLVYRSGADGVKRALELLREIRRRRYGAVMDFEQRSLLTASFMRLTSIPVRVGFVSPEPDPRRRLFTHSVELAEGEPMWNAFTRLGRVLDPQLPEQLMTVPLPYSAETDLWMEKWWSANVGSDPERRTVAIHLGVGPSAQYRRWPVDRFVELAERLRSGRKDLTVILTGDSGEQHLIADFAQRFRGKSIDASNLGGLERTAALLRRCGLLISCDTGIMHLGAAMGIPTVGLFGPNTPACWAPVGPRATYVYATRLSCSPCINSYRRLIPQTCTAPTYGACMSDIGVHEVLRAAQAVVRDDWLGPAESVATIEQQSHFKVTQVRG
jgi:LSD1 subclass zinc finger protein